MDVRLRAYKWLALDLDGFGLILVRNTLERLRRFDGKRSSGKCGSKIVPYSNGSLALRCMSTAAVLPTPEIVGDARIHSQETQSLNRAEWKSVDGVRGLQTQVRNISRELPLDVLRDRMRDSTTPEAIVDPRDMRHVRISDSLAVDTVLSFGVVVKWVTPFDEVGFRY